MHSWLRCFHGAAIALLLGFSPARAQWAEWRDVPCAESNLLVAESSRCTVREYIHPRMYPRTVLFSRTRSSGMRDGIWFEMEFLQGPTRGYGEAKSEENMRVFVANRTRTNVVWGKVRTHGAVSHVDFESFGRACTAFDMADQYYEIVIRYRYMLRGFACMPPGERIGFDVLRPYLAATRIYTGDDAMNPFGERSVAPWPTRATTTAPPWPPQLDDEGWRALNGNGVPKDERGGIALIRQAAELGNAQAQGRLAWGYREGRWGLQRSYADALRWGDQALANGHVSAGNDLGMLHRDGLGVAKDAAKAARYFEDCANANGTTWCARNLGLLYRDGNGVPRDKEKAREWLQKAAASGNKAAEQELARLD